MALNSPHKIQGLSWTVRTPKQITEKKQIYEELLNINKKQEDNKKLNK